MNVKMDAECNRTNYLEVVHFGLAFPGQLVFGHPLLDLG